MAAPPDAKPLMARLFPLCCGLHTGLYGQSEGERKRGRIMGKKEE